MRKVKLAIILLLGIVTIVGFAFFLIGVFKPRVAGIYIETNPSSTVYINGERVGRSTFRTTRRPGEVVIRLIPDSFQNPLSPYETKVNLVQGVETVVRYNFGEGDDSSGDIISFEKIPGDETSLVVVTIPDSSELVIDAGTKVFTPFKTSLVTPGAHRLTISASGYLERNVEVKTHQGYKLTAIVKLGRTQPEQVGPTPTPIPEEGGEVSSAQIEILSTPTGFLRVRSEPSTLGDEVGRVSPGEKHKMLSEDEKTGWYEIELSDAKKGWVSNQYAKKISVSEKVTPTPTPSITKVPST